MHKLAVGDKNVAELRVEENHTAAAFGSGSIFVFSTPMMIGLMENAALKCAEIGLDSGYSTVGMSVEIVHIAATPMGQKVKAIAEIVGIEGKKLTFKVEAYDEMEKIGEGKHERYIINVEKFMNKVEEKRGKNA